MDHDIMEADLAPQQVGVIGLGLAVLRRLQAMLAIGSGTSSRSTLTTPLLQQSSAPAGMQPVEEPGMDGRPGTRSMEVCVVFTEGPELVSHHHVRTAPGVQGLQLGLGLIGAVAIQEAGSCPSAGAALTPSTTKRGIDDAKSRS